MVKTMKFKNVTVLVFAGNMSPLLIIYNIGCINFHLKNCIQVLIILISSILFSLLMKSSMSLQI